MDYPGEEEQNKMFRSKKEHEDFEKIQVAQPKSEDEMSITEI